MKRLGLALVLLLWPLALSSAFERDTLNTPEGDLIISFIGHGTLMFEYAGKIVHVDPWTKLADYSTLPQADLVLVTHHHGDHLDKQALDQVLKENSILIWTETCSTKLKRTGRVMKNGDKTTVLGFDIEAVPAYNLKKKFHPRGTCNGYVITFGGTRVYVAGDTEDVPEMADLKDIDIAFLPMNLPYTMTPEMTAHAARMVQPDILYPYHYGDTPVDELARLLKDDFQGEMRIRSMQ